MAEIIIAKHRNGEVKDVRLKFQGEYARFSDWCSEEEMPPLPEDDGLTRPSKVNSINKDNADPGFSSITADMAPADLGPDGDIPPF